MTNRSELIVIGSGPGGYVAAIRAAQLGLQTTLIEKDALGGICLNWGCIPTKALLRSAEVLDLIQHSESFGIKTGKPTVDFKKMIDRSRTVSGQLSQGIAHLLKKNKVKVVAGTGKLLKKKGDLHQVEVTDKDGKKQTLEAAKVILATGARARTFPHLQPDGKNIWTSREAMVPEKQPQSLLIVGSGAIGMEFAGFYNALGVDVTVVEIQKRILPAEDAEISAAAQKAFEQKGIKILTDTTVENLNVTSKGVEATLKGKATKTLSAEKVLLAIGVVGNTENIGIENTAIKVEKGQIAVNEWCQTHEAGIYAIGDVAGAPWLAHKASHEGVLVAGHAAGQKGLHPLHRNRVPGCTYTAPQIASVGLTEEAAKSNGHKIKVGRFPYLGNGKAIALGEPEGLIKTIFDEKTGELLGAHMIGAEVTELIQGYTLGMTLEATEAEFMGTIFPHPTLSEMMHESVLNAYGQAIHI